MKLLKTIKNLILGCVLGLAIFTLARPSDEFQTVSYKAKARETVYLLKASNPEILSACSVVAIAPNRAFSARHCSLVQEPVVVLKDGTKLPIQRTFVDPERDLALFVVPGLKCPCAQISQVEVIQDEQVISVGYPMGLAQVVQDGFFQNRVVMEEIGYNYELLQSALNGIPGMSGGGLFVIRDGNPYLVGIMVAMWPGTNISFSVEVKEDSIYGL